MSPALRICRRTSWAGSRATRRVDRFAEDPAPEVQREAAGDPRVSPAALVRLLLDERHASWAARNTSIPVPVMHAMIGIASRLTAEAPDSPEPGAPHR